MHCTFCIVQCIHVRSQRRAGEGGEGGGGEGGGGEGGGGGGEQRAQVRDMQRVSISI